MSRSWLRRMPNRNVFRSETPGCSRSRPSSCRDADTLLSDGTNARTHLAGIDGREGRRAAPPCVFRRNSATDTDLTSAIPIWCMRNDASVVCRSTIMSAQERVRGPARVSRQCEVAAVNDSPNRRFRPNRAALEPGRTPRKRTFAWAGRLGGRDYLTTRELPDATWSSGDPLIDANIRPILAARVFSGNATRTRHDPRVRTGGARS